MDLVWHIYTEFNLIVCNISSTNKTVDKPFNYYSVSLEMTSVPFKLDKKTENLVKFSCCFITIAY